MKLRYYLRGIGLGIIVAAAICICASLRNKETLSDAEIKARAEALGMVESGATLLDTASATPVEDTAEPVEEDKMEPVQVSEIAVPVAGTEDATEAEEEASESESADESEETVEATDPEEEESEEEEATEEQARPEPETPSTGEIITVMVDKGNGSDTVARRLAEAGLVANAAEYDRYLMANGYDRRIAAGLHKIPKGASDEEIAKLLVSKQD